jgi:predicted TIM-barrel fold metal-dependent hydrolase
LVLSDAYWFDSPKNQPVADAYAKMRAENEWTAREIARFPDRLVAFCSFNPLAEYALAEVDRCASDSRFRGLKLHFGMSVVDLKNPEHVEKVRRVFEAANRRRLPIIVHVRADQTYGREHAEILLSQLLPAAPVIPVPIAHLWGGEAFSDSALAVYADAVSAGRPATKNLYFDVAESVLVAGASEETLRTIAQRIRQIGPRRILYGTDGPVPEALSPREGVGCLSHQAAADRRGAPDDRGQCGSVSAVSPAGSSPESAPGPRRQPTVTARVSPLGAKLSSLGWQTPGPGHPHH